MKTWETSAEYLAEYYWYVTDVYYFIVHTEKQISKNN